MSRAMQDALTAPAARVRQAFNTKWSQALNFADSTLRNKNRKVSPIASHMRAMYKCDVKGVLLKAYDNEDERPSQDQTKKSSKIASKGTLRGAVFITLADGPRNIMEPLSWSDSSKTSHLLPFNCEPGHLHWRHSSAAVSGVNGKDWGEVAFTDSGRLGGGGEGGCLEG
jgi:hypothetical protein